MVDVPHNSDNRRTWQQVLFGIFFLFVDGFLNFNAYKFNRIAEFIGNNIDRFCIQALVDRYKKSERHTSRDNLCHTNIHHGCQFGYRHEFR